MSITLNYDAAVAALKAQATSTDVLKAGLASAGLAALQNNKAYFLGLGEQAIMGFLTAYLGGQDETTALQGLSLPEQAAVMVTGSASVATQQYNFAQRMLTVAKVGAAVVATVLAALVGL